VDQIVISGDGNEPYPAFSVYEAENATLSGSASAGFCGNCSGLASVGNLGGSPQSAVTFENVNVPATGMYQVEIDYMTQGQRSFFVSVNGNAAKELPLNGYSFGTPTSIVIQVPLHAGSNQIEFSNPSNYAPNLDSITISPPMVFEAFFRNPPEGDRRWVPILSVSGRDGNTRFPKPRWNSSLATFWAYMEPCFRQFIASAC
jgi:hypothetical protein